MSALDRDLTRLVAKVRHASMVPDESLIFSWRSMLEVLGAGRPGAVVECGTWLGGCAFGMALAQKKVFGRVIRPVWMFDSFEGLPPATGRDGQAALEYQRRVGEPGYFDNCRAPLDRVIQIRQDLGLSDAECRLVPGWFDRTLPPARQELSAQGIAFLRIDCDWYDPVRLVLEQFEPLVNDEGVVVLDDYYAWDGCARAVHDFLSATGHAYRLRQIGAAAMPLGTWFIKRAARVLGGPL